MVCAAARRGGAPETPAFSSLERRAGGKPAFGLCRSPAPWAAAKISRHNGDEEAVKTPAGKTSASKAPAGKSTGKGAGVTAPRAARKPSAAVYRRRRLFAGGALLLVLGLTAGGVATVSGALNAKTEQASSTEGGGASEPSGGQTAPAASAAPSATPTASPTCDQKLVTVSAATNKTSYGPDEKPVLTLKVANGGKLPCKVNIGTSQMEYLVTSGSDRIFSSKDCQASSNDLVKTIAPGKSETANFPWPRNRSVQGCEKISDAAGAGYYVFIAKLGAKVSPPTVFQLN